MHIHFSTNSLFTFFFFFPNTNTTGARMGCALGTEEQSTVGNKTGAARREDQPPTSSAPGNLNKSGKQPSIVSGRGKKRMNQDLSILTSATSSPQQGTPTGARNSILSTAAASGNSLIATTRGCVGGVGGVCRTSLSSPSSLQSKPQSNSPQSQSRRSTGDGSRTSFFLQATTDSGNDADGGGSGSLANTRSSSPCLSQEAAKPLLVEVPNPFLPPPMSLLQLQSGSSSVSRGSSAAERETLLPDHPLQRYSAGEPPLLQQQHSSTSQPTLHMSPSDAPSALASTAAPSMSSFHRDDRTGSPTRAQSTRISLFDPRGGVQSVGFTEENDPQLFGTTGGGGRGEGGGGSLAPRPSSNRRETVTTDQDHEVSLLSSRANPRLVLAPGTTTTAATGGEDHLLGFLPGAPVNSGEVDSTCEGGAAKSSLSRRPRRIEVLDSIEGVESGPDDSANETAATVEAPMTRDPQQCPHPTNSISALLQLIQEEEEEPLLRSGNGNPAFNANPIPSNYGDTGGAGYGSVQRTLSGSFQSGLQAQGQTTLRSTQKSDQSSPGEKYSSPASSVSPQFPVSPGHSMEKDLSSGKLPPKDRVGSRPSANWGVTATSTSSSRRPTPSPQPLSKDGDSGAFWEVGSVESSLHRELDLNRRDSALGFSTQEPVDARWWESEFIRLKGEYDAESAPTQQQV